MLVAPAVQIVEASHGATTVLRLVGEVSETGLVVRLAQELIENRIDGGHIVLDLDDLVVADASALCAFLARLAVCTGGVPVPTVASDPGVRRLLRACGSGAAGLACFASLDEAAAVARPSVTTS